MDYLTRTPEGGADLEAARRRLGGDTQLLRDLAQFYVEDAATLLNEAARGIDLGDSELAARAAHSLKGQSANFSARCASAAQEVEDVLRQGDFAEGRRRLEQLRHEVDALIAVLQRDVLADRGKPDA